MPIFFKKKQSTIAKEYSGLWGFGHFRRRIQVLLGNNTFSHSLMQYL